MAPSGVMAKVLRSMPRTQLAHLLVHIGQQIEGQVQFGLEVLVGFHAVPRDTEYLPAQGLELRMQVAKILAFGGAARSAVLGIKIKDDAASFVITESDVPAAGGGQ
jgi:hypothetical protein